MSAFEKETIDDWFDFHPASPERAERHKQVTEMFKEFAERLNKVLPQNADEAFTVMERLREACLWTNAALACYEVRFGYLWF